MIQLFEVKKKIKKLKREDAELVEKDIPLVSYLIKYINKHMEEFDISGNVRIEFASEDEVLDIFRRKATG